MKLSPQDIITLHTFHFETFYEPNQMPIDVWPSNNVLAFGVTIDNNKIIDIRTVVYLISIVYKY